LAIALVAICSVAARVSAQTTVTLSTPGTHITADMTIRGGDYAVRDFSRSVALVSKASSDNKTRRIMMTFDTERFIPANAVIRRAQLELVLRTADDGAERPLSAFHVTESFVSGETSWNYFRYGQAWNSPGGDLGARFATTSVDNAVGSTYTFDLTRLVQRAVTGRLGSRHTRVALVDTGDDSRGSYRSFHSTRAANPAYRPRLVITYSTSTPPPPPVPPPPPRVPPAPSPATTLRVMQWNIHKGEGSDGRCSADRIASTIAGQDVHVASLNEVKSFAGACSWNFDMAAKLESLLEQKTGVDWHRKYVHIGSKGGNVLLSRLPLVSSSSTLLSHDRGVAHISVVVNGRTVNLFSTHVEYFNSSWRPIQIAEAVRWMSNFSTPRIMMGDFNTRPGTSEYYSIARPYSDAWVAAQRNRTARAYNGSGATHGSSRFDYVFYSVVEALSLRSVTVPQTRIRGVHPSDHDPVIAVFGVN
jgi:endonuclease/exonuclease/phosphatase family metal-dependent hydrolase